MTPRGRLFRKYVIVFAGLVSGALLASGAIEVYFSYQENRAALVALQREKALGVASRIEDFIKDKTKYEAVDIFRKFDSVTIDFDASAKTGTVVVTVDPDSIDTGNRSIDGRSGDAR